MDTEVQAVHRSGPFKQPPKGHKPWKGKVKGSRNRWKIEKKGVKAVRLATFRDLTKKQRKHRTDQLRKLKREEVLTKKRGLSDSDPPIIVAVLSLNDSHNPHDFIASLKSCCDNLKVSSTQKFGHCHINFPRQKQRFTFIVPDKSDLISVMDALKVADTLLIIHTCDGLSEYENTLLSVIVSHALPTTVHVVRGIDKLSPKKKADIKKVISKAMETRFPEEKLHHADTDMELQLLLRHIGCQKQKAIGFRDERPHLLAENVEYCTNTNLEGIGTLKVTGYILGKALSVNGLVHIPGWGDYQMSAIDYYEDPHALVVKNKSKMTDGMAVDCPFQTDRVDTVLQESLQSEVVPDPMEGEQTWPTEEELQEAEEEMKKTVVKRKKVPEGTSDYQAAWIIDDYSEGSGSEEDESEAEDDAMSLNSVREDMESEKIEEESIIDVQNENYDKNIDMDEEKKMLVKFKEEQMNQEYPDEEDTPMGVSAQIKYQKYRGLKSFGSSIWDHMENLPLDYARIFRFGNFKLTKKKVFNAENEGALPGSYVTVHITNVPQSLYDSIEENSLLVVYGLLTHEQKMSVMNVTIRKHASCKTPIKSKDDLIFHIGFRRFMCKPIFSEHRTGNKFKYERFLPLQDVVVASFYAPVIFPPASAIVFKLNHKGVYELVATGTLKDVNPNRIVVKRTVLSGHPFRIHKRSAVVRFMFFNREDINWFKCVELSSKYGRRGHIKEALGSHGHMKCVFDKQITSMDVVFMCLYKRVFPKWTYDLCTPTPFKLYENSMESLM